MKVSELMSRTVISVPPEATASALSRLLSRHHIGAAPVIDGRGRLRGIVTDRDIVCRCVAAEEMPATTRVRDIMTRSVVTVGEDTDVREAARLMSDGRVRRLPVLRGDVLVGMLSIGDLSRVRICDAEVSRALSEISAKTGRA